MVASAEFQTYDFAAIVSTVFTFQLEDSQSKSATFLTYRVQMHTIRYLLTKRELLRHHPIQMPRSAGGEIKSEDRQISY